MAIGMGHQFIAFFAGRIERERMVDVVVHREGHRCVGTIDAGTAGINEMLYSVVAATFKNVGEANDIALDVGKRVLDGVAHTGLRSEIHHSLRSMRSERIFDSFFVGQINTQVNVILMIGMSSQSRFFDGRVVVVVVIVDANDGIAAFQQSHGEIGADKAGRAGDEDFQLRIAPEQIAGVDLIRHACQNFVQLL